MFLDLARQISIYSNNLQQTVCSNFLFWIQEKVLINQQLSFQKMFWCCGFHSTTCSSPRSFACYTFHTEMTSVGNILNIAYSIELQLQLLQCLLQSKMASRNTAMDFSQHLLPFRCRHNNLVSSSFTISIFQNFSMPLSTIRESHCAQQHFGARVLGKISFQTGHCVFSINLSSASYAPT